MVITFNCYLAQTMLGTKKNKIMPKEILLSSPPQKIQDALSPVPQEH